jgi:hypothetical protein
MFTVGASSTPRGRGSPFARRGKRAVCIMQMVGGELRIPWENAYPACGIVPKFAWYNSCRTRTLTTGPSWEILAATVGEAPVNVIAYLTNT